MSAQQMARKEHFFRPIAEERLVSSPVIAPKTCSPWSSYSERRRLKASGKTISGKQIKTETFSMQDVLFTGGKVSCGPKTIRKKLFVNICSVFLFSCSWLFKVG